MGRLLLQFAGQNSPVPDMKHFVGRILDAFGTAAQSEIGKADVTFDGNVSLIEPLTDREMDVLRLLAKRLTNKEIGLRLHISPLTVKRHTINIYQKLGVNDRREAVTKARALGLLL